MTFFVQAPIFMWREHFRHRIASYNEESGRYKVLEPTFYVPGPERNLVQVGKPGAYEFLAGSDEQHELVVAETEARLPRRVLAPTSSMLDAGVAREVARIVLPLTIYSSAYVTMNARALMNFLSLRTQGRGPALPVASRSARSRWSPSATSRSGPTLMPLTHAAFVANGRVAP